MKAWLKPQPFIANHAPQFPAWTRKRGMEKQKLYFPSYNDQRPRDDYVHEFDTLNGLKPNPIKWIRPSMGNFG